MKVFIDVFTLNIRVAISIDTDANTFLCNSRKLDIDTIPFVTRLQHITGSWSDYMLDDSITDGMTYSVTYKTDKSTRSYMGANRFPLNYPDFERLIWEVV